MLHALDFAILITEIAPSVWIYSSFLKHVVGIKYVQQLMQILI